MTIEYVVLVVLVVAMTATDTGKVVVREEGDDIRKRIKYR